MKRVLLCLLIPLGGCAQPFEGRIASQLAEAGLPRPVAECMATRWVDRLSVAQLQKLSVLAEDLQSERSQGRLNVGGLAQRVAALDDPELVEVVTTSSLACALAG